jgi:hypothetical protein
MDNDEYCDRALMEKEMTDDLKEIEEAEKAKLRKEGAKNELESAIRLLALSSCEEDFFDAVEKLKERLKELEK